MRESPQLTPKQNSPNYGQRREMTYPLLDLSVVSTLIPFLVSTLFIKRFKDQKDLLLLWLLFLSTAATEVTMDVLSRMHTHNLLIFHTYSLVEYVLVLSILARWHPDANAGKWMRRAILAYLATFFVIKATGLEGLDTDSQNFITRPIALLIMIGFTFDSLHALWRKASTNLSRDYRFWFMFAFAIYYSGTIALFSFTYLKGQTLLFIVHLHAVLNVFRNILCTATVCLAANTTVVARPPLEPH